MGLFFLITLLIQVWVGVKDMGRTGSGIVQDVLQLKPNAMPAGCSSQPIGRIAPGAFQVRSVATEECSAHLHGPVRKLARRRPGIRME